MTSQAKTEELSTLPNHAFASYATGSAFRIDLSRKMVVALLSAASGKRLDTGYYGVTGLVNRGLMEPAQEQASGLYLPVRMTPAGEKVAALCLMAGLGTGL